MDEWGTCFKRFDKYFNGNFTNLYVNKNLKSQEAAPNGPKSDLH